MEQFVARKNVVSGYLEQEVLQWSREKIILKTYDLFIVACKRRDIPKMNAVLDALINALNFEYEEPATRLYQLYDYCKRLVMQRRFDEALHIIQELRNAWAQAFHLEEESAPAEEVTTNTE